MANGEHRELFQQFLKNPRGIGAVAPSSRGLARRMVASLPLNKASVVVEYGPGTGVFTAEVLKSIGPSTYFAAIECNAVLARGLRQRFPRLHLREDSMVNVEKILQDSGHEHADCIVSGLPWASFGAELQDAALSATARVLRPGGKFATFAYLQGLLLPPGKRFAQRLHATFPQIEKTPVVWKNIPPAFVYICTA